MRLNVGRIGRAHGILGEATIEVRTDDAASRFALGARLETDDHGDLTVESVRVHNGILLLSFKGYSDRNAVEKLRDALLYADIDINAPGEDEDDYHVLQLVGVSGLSRRWFSGRGDHRCTQSARPGCPCYRRWIV